MLAAAAKHLTPVLLELGGKSPVVIDKNINLKVTTSFSLLIGVMHIQHLYEATTSMLNCLVYKSILYGDFQVF